jgi:hypothetical protein
MCGVGGLGRLILEQFAHQPNQNHYGNDRINYRQNRISQVSPANIMGKGGFGQEKLKPLAGAGHGDLLPSLQNQFQDQDKDKKQDSYL